MAVFRLEEVDLIREGRLILPQVSVAFGAGEYVAIIGENGTGKSTLLEVLTGQIPVSTGRIRIADQSLKEFKEWWRLGYLPQRASESVPVKISVSEYIWTGWHPASKVVFIENLQNLLKFLDLEDYRHALVGSLSGGQKQRVYLARALINNPEWLLLDEPTSAVDVQTRRQINAYLAKLHQEKGLTILFVTHALPEIAQEVDRVVCLGKTGAESSFLPSGVKIEHIQHLGY